VGRGRHRLSVLDSRHLSQLRRHVESRALRQRLIRWQRLFFGFTLGADGSLKSQARAMLSGGVFHRSVSGWFRLCRGPAFKGEDHLAYFNFLAFLDANFLHHAVDGRGNFHNRFIGFQLHHRLAFGNFVACRNHQPD
jgi:hypothetical protein